MAQFDDDNAPRRDPDRMRDLTQQKYDSRAKTQTFSHDEQGPEQIRDDIARSTNMNQTSKPPKAPSPFVAVATELRKVDAELNRMAEQAADLAARIYGDRAPQIPPRAAREQLPGEIGELSNSVMDLRESAQQLAELITFLSAEL